jgi:anti-anti-sigma regulatory factor
LARVKFIDSTAVALLVRMNRRLRRAGWQLVLLEPSIAVIRALQLMGLEDFFLKAADALEARRVIQESTPQEERDIPSAPLLPQEVSFGGR